jgi:hypothetical protein
VYIFLFFSRCCPHDPSFPKPQSLEDAERWAGAFDLVRDYVFVALCDDDLVTGACAVVDAVFRALGVHAFPSLPTLASTLQMLFPDGPHRSQAAVQDLLTGLYNAGAPWDRAVTRTLTGLPQNALNSSLGRLIAFMRGGEAPQQ